MDVSARLVAQRYRLGKKIGEGAVATVYEAIDTRGHRPVAVKVLKDLSDQDDTARLWIELQSLQRVDHPGVLRPLDMGRSGHGLGYIVTELLRGRTLRARLVASGRLSIEVTLPLLLQIFETLSACHTQRVIHRDVKPENVFLLAPDEGRLKLIDFGMAKLLSDSVGEGLTRPHEVFGTPEYMAPERIAGGPPTPATDIYAAAIVGFEMLAGKRPFSGRTPDEVMRRQLHTALPRFSELPTPVTVPREIRAILRRCLRKLPEQRPQAAAVATILGREAHRRSLLPPTAPGSEPAPPRSSSGG